MAISRAVCWLQNCSGGDCSQSVSSSRGIRHHGREDRGREGCPAPSAARRYRLAGSARGDNHEPGPSGMNAVDKFVSRAEFGPESALVSNIPRSGVSVQRG